MDPGSVVLEALVVPGVNYLIARSLGVGESQGRSLM